MSIRLYFTGMAGALAVSGCHYNLYSEPEQAVVQQPMEAQQPEDPSEPEPIELTARQVQALNVMNQFIYELERTIETEQSQKSDQRGPELP